AVLCKRRHHSRNHRAKNSISDEIFTIARPWVCLPYIRKPTYENRRIHHRSFTYRSGLITLQQKVPLNVSFRCPQRYLTGRYSACGGALGDDRHSCFSSHASGSIRSTHTDMGWSWPHRGFISVIGGVGRGWAHVAD